MGGCFVCWQSAYDRYRYRRTSIAGLIFILSFFFFTAEDVVWGIIKAVPFVAATGAAAYFYYKAVTVKDSGRVNMSLKKDLECVVSTAFIEDIGDQTSFCRCWRSSKVQLLLDT